MERPRSIAAMRQAVKESITGSFWNRKKMGASKRQETFSFCVGRPWPKSPTNPERTSICVYAYGAQVHHGTMQDAEAFRIYVNKETGEENLIYKLVPVSSSS